MLRFGAINAAAYEALSVAAINTAPRAGFTFRPIRPFPTLDAGDFTTY